MATSTHDLNLLLLAAIATRKFATHDALAEIKGLIDAGADITAKDSFGIPIFADLFTCPDFVSRPRHVDWDRHLIDTATPRILSPKINNKTGRLIRGLGDVGISYSHTFDGNRNLLHYIFSYRRHFIGRAIYRQMKSFNPLHPQIRIMDRDLTSHVSFHINDIPISWSKPCSQIAEDIVDKCKILIEKGVDPHAKDNDGNTPTAMFLITLSQFQGNFYRIKRIVQLVELFDEWPQTIQGEPWYPFVHQFSPELARLLAKAYCKARPYSELEEHHQQEISICTAPDDNLEPMRDSEMEKNEFNDGSHCILGNSIWKTNFNREETRSHWARIMQENELLFDCLNPDYTRDDKWRYSSFKDNCTHTYMTKEILQLLAITTIKNRLPPSLKLKVLEYLKKQGLCLNFVDGDGNTLLHYYFDTQVRHLHPEMIDFFFDNALDFSQMNNNKVSPMMLMFDAMYDTFRGLDTKIITCNQQTLKKILHESVDHLAAFYKGMSLLEYAIRTDPFVGYVAFKAVKHRFKDRLVDEAEVTETAVYSV